MPFPLNPSPRRDTPTRPGANDPTRQIPGPSMLNSPEPDALHDAPARPGDSGTQRPFTGTACGCRSNRPSGVR